MTVYVSNWGILSERLRGTGRTTRMLNKAIALAKEGRAVYVVGASTDHCKLMEQYMVSQTVDYHALGIKFETLNSLGNFDLANMQNGLAGAHPNCVVLVDHYVIEVRHGLLLKELHAYDPEPPDRDEWIFKVRRQMFLIAAKLEESATLPDPRMDTWEMLALAKEIKSLVP